MTTQTHPDHPAVPVVIDQLRVYGEALKDWVMSCNFLPDAKPMEVVMATPDRAYSALKSMLEEKYGPRSERLRLTPYPFGSLSRTAVRFAPDRFRGVKTAFYAAKADKDYAWKFLWPRPWDMDFTLDVFANTFQAANPLLSWLMEQISPEGWLTVDFTGIWPGYAKRLIPIVGGQITDNSDLEPEVGDRSVRFSVTLTLRGWLFLPPVEIPLVQKIVLDAHLMPQGTPADVTAGDIDSNPTIYPRAFQRTIDEDGAR